MKRRKAREEEILAFSKSQRRCANEFTNTVWQLIRNRQLYGHKFRRESPIPPYTADFCCLELKLILEIDGAEHFTQEGRALDKHRDQFLNRLGFQILRIPGYEVIRDGRKVIEKVQQVVKEREIHLISRQNPPLP